MQKLIATVFAVLSLSAVGAGIMIMDNAQPAAGILITDNARTGVVLGD